LNSNQTGTGGSVGGSVGEVRGDGDETEEEGHISERKKTCTLVASSIGFVTLAPGELGAPCDP
jgi:hypothetical protein